MEEPQFRRTVEGDELYREILVRATPERIWAILTAFSEYPEWNPFIKSIRGNLVAGERLTADLQPPGSSVTTIRPVLTRVDPHRELRWEGHLLVRGLFNGEHVFEIRPVDGMECLFVQREIFSGLLLPLLRPMLQTSTARGFAAMNAALKARAERGTV